MKTDHQIKNPVEMLNSKIGIPQELYELENRSKEVDMSTEG